MEKAYIVKLENGEQMGPLDEEALKRLAQAGSIPENAEIRSTMLAIWEKAKNTDCLKKIYRAQMLKRAEAYANDPKAQLMARLEMRGDYDPLATALSQEGITYQDAGFLSRFVAGLMDLAILAAAALLLLFLAWSLMRGGHLSPNGALCLFALLTWTVAATYYMAFLCLRGQTIGQRFWGLVVVTQDLRRVYPIKGLLFFFLLVALGPLSPLTWLLTGCRCTLQELVPALRVRHITVTRKG